ncbi:MAG: hypothetical protein HRU33_09780 [Rhodobacteraceae bacterium]|nr:hypothetical protein [Paracoccaceae bacterium]
MAGSGLWIGGISVGREADQFLSILKFACVPQADWSLPAFNSNDIEQVLGLADSLSVEIISAMINDYLAHEFETTEELAQNIALRKGVIAAMQAICSGEFDGDYSESVVGIPPTLGYLNNLEVLFAPGAATGNGILTTPAPFANTDSTWERLETGNPWVGSAFVQQKNVDLSTALGSTQPFRGECAGALQLSILQGCLSALGAEKLNALSAGSGPAFIGIWHLPVEGIDAIVDTLATRFLAQLNEIPADYARGSVLGVPGDYLYFHNKDDYPTKAQAGAWRGENCIYLGLDALGNPHYSGMGLGWKTEFALRMFLGNAYVNDCNTDFIEAIRQGNTPTMQLAVVEDAQAQLRFTKRGVMQYPDVLPGPAPKMQLPTDVPNPLTDAEYRKRLEMLGFHAPDGGSPAGCLVSELLLGELVETLGFPEAALHQSTSAGLGRANLDVTLGRWTLGIQPKDSQIRHLSMDDHVHVVAHFAD